MPREKKNVAEVKSTFPVPWKPEQEGDTLEGTYHGYNIVPDGRGQTFKSHKFKEDGAEEYDGISGAMIDQKMERIPKGTYVWVTYLGEVQTKNGKAKDFKVECDSTVKLLDPSESNAADDMPI